MRDILQPDYKKHRFNLDTGNELSQRDVWHSDDPPETNRIGVLCKSIYPSDQLTTEELKERYGQDWVVKKEEPEEEAPEITFGGTRVKEEETDAEQNEPVSPLPGRGRVGNEIKSFKKKKEKKVEEPDTDDLLWSMLMQVRGERQDIQRDLDRLDQM